MTAEDSQEEAADTTRARVASEPDDQSSDANRTSDDVEGEGDFDSVEISASFANRVQLADRGEEQSHGIEEQEETVVIEHGGTDPYGGGGDTKEEDEDCPFCLYMKSGACGESFADWEECINDGEKTEEDVVEKCVKVTRLLTQCMRANADYYLPVLEAEKAAIAVSVASANGDGLQFAAAQAEAERAVRETVEVEAQTAAEEVAEE